MKVSTYKTTPTIWAKTNSIYIPSVSFRRWARRGFRACRWSLFNVWTSVIWTFYRTGSVAYYGVFDWQRRNGETRNRRQKALDHRPGNRCKPKTRAWYRSVWYRGGGGRYDLTRPECCRFLHACYDFVEKPRICPTSFAYILPDDIWGRFAKLIFHRRSPFLSNGSPVLPHQYKCRTYYLSNYYSWSVERVIPLFTAKRSPSSFKSGYPNFGFPYSTRLKINQWRMS